MQLRKHPSPAGYSGLMNLGEEEGFDNVVHFQMQFLIWEKIIKGARNAGGARL